MPLGLQDIDLGTTPGDETGTPGRTCFDRINQNNTAIESAVNLLNGQFWTLDNTARSLALGERVQSDTHAGITHTLPSVFVYNAGNLNDIWIVNHDSAESITVAVASGDQLYRQGTGLGVDATIAIAPGQLAIFSIRSDSATWNVIVLADEQTITGGSGDLLADGTIPMTAAWSMGGFGISNVGSIACTTFTSTGIDDNATGERLQLADTLLVLGAAASDYGIANASDVNWLGISGGTDSSTGANIILYGSTHATKANDISIRANLVTEAYYDDSASEWDFQGNSLINASAGYNNQTGTTYTIVAADNGKVITFDNAAACAVTLPDTLDTNFQCTIVQVGAGVPTVTPNTDTVNGAGTGVAPSAQWKGMYLSQYSATNWLALL